MDRRKFFGKDKTMNLLRTGMLMAALTALFVGVGWMVGGVSGMVIAFAIAAGTNAFAWWNSDKMALHAHNAQRITEMTHPRLVQAVARLSREAGLPMPAVYLIDSRQANAFATGRNPDNAAVAVTSGLLHHLNQEEVEGVIAHELAHIKNRDTLIMTIAATFAGAISFLAQIGLWFGGSREHGKFGFVGVLLAALLAPMAAALIQATISRGREYGADAEGAAITGNPLGLASALAKISNQANWVQLPSAELHPGTAHMFIHNPLIGVRVDRLFSTHPPAERRIAALEAMAYNDGYRLPPKPKMRLSPSRIPRVLRK
jgi:heat shock protein HtpX